MSEVKIYMHESSANITPQRHGLNTVNRETPNREKGESKDSILGIVNIWTLKKLESMKGV